MSTLKELKANIQKVIQKMKSNLTNKGVDVSTTPETLNALADKINDVSQGQVPSSTVYSVDLGIYGYSEEQLKKVKEILDQCLVKVWETPEGQTILNETITNLTIFNELKEKNNGIPLILIPNIKVGSNIYFRQFTNTLYCGNIDIENSSIRLENVFDVLPHCTNLPDGSWTNAYYIDNFMGLNYNIENVDIELNSERIIKLFGSFQKLKKLRLICNKVNYISQPVYACPVFDDLYIECMKAETIYYMGSVGNINISKIVIVTGGYTSNIIDTTINNCPFVLIKGVSSNAYSVLNMAFYPKWGTGGEENRQSLIDTLITYSYNRAQHGLKPGIVKLHKDVIPLLTDEEITTINNKGYTVGL